MTEKQRVSRQYPYVFWCKLASFFCIVFVKVELLKRITLMKVC
jgi:hypothetical protein